MKKSGFLRLIVLMITVFLLSLMTPYCVHADEANQGSTQVRLFTEPQSLKLPRNNTSYWFMIPQGTQLGENNSISLHFTVTGTLLDDHSSMTVSVNDVLVGSTRLLSSADVENGWWNLAIPSSCFKTDGTLNQLTIITAQRSILGDCADIDDPANWVTLDSDSTLNLDVTKKGIPTLGTLFPFFCNRVDQQNAINMAFLFPKDDKDAESAMLTIASAIDMEYPSKSTVSLTSSDISGSTDTADRFYIGEGTELSGVNTDIPKLNQGEGYLSVYSQDDSNNCIVYGADQEGIQKAAAFFTNADMLNQISGQTAVITTDLRTQVNSSLKNEEGYYTLKDFGYTTTSLAGAFHQETTFHIRQPESLVCGSGSYIEVHFAHSRALLADTSLLTVYVNDVAIDSVQLSDSNADDGKIRIAIPEEARSKQDLELKIDCYNYLGKIDCSKDYYDTAWTVINEDSVIYLEPADLQITPTLTSFPRFEVIANTVKKVLIQMPSDADDGLKSAAGMLALREGQHSGTAGTWTVSDEVSADSQKSQSDVLYLGTVENNKIPQEIIDVLPVYPVYSKDGGQLAIRDMKNDQSVITQEGLRNKIVIEAIPSPWNAQKTIYVVFCPTDMEKMLVDFLSNAESLAKAGGVISLLDGDGNVTAIDDAEIAKISQVKFSFSNLISKIVRFTGIPQIGLLIILILLVLVIILIIRALRNQSRFRKARIEMEKVNSVPKVDAAIEESGNNPEAVKVEELSSSSIEADESDEDADGNREDSFKQDKNER